MQVTSTSQMTFKNGKSIYERANNTTVFQSKYECETE